MRRKKVLSKSGVDRLLSRLEEVATSEMEYIDDSEARITTEFIRKVTGVKDITQVIDENEALTKRCQGFINMYGFDNMYDLYIYAMSCDPKPEEIKKAKDFSSLVAVKRKVVRNGKEHEVTVWVKPDEADEQSQEGTGGTQSRGTRRRRSAREMKGSMSDDISNPKNLGELKLVSSKLEQGNKEFNDHSDMYYKIVDEEGKVVGVAGYLERGKYLTMDFYRSTGDVSGVATKGFMNLLKVAVEKGKGVIMEDIPQAGGLFYSSGLRQNDKGDWVIEADELKNILEGSSD